VPNRVSPFDGAVRPGARPVRLAWLNPLRQANMPAGSTGALADFSAAATIGNALAFPSDLARRRTVRPSRARLHSEERIRTCERRSSIVYRSLGRCPSSFPARLPVFCRSLGRCPSSLCLPPRPSVSTLRVDACLLPVLGSVPFSPMRVSRTALGLAGLAGVLNNVTFHSQRDVWSLERVSSQRSS